MRAFGGGRLFLQVDGLIYRVRLFQSRSVCIGEPQHRYPKMNTTTLNENAIREQVRERYGTIATGQVSGCCSGGSCGGTAAATLGYKPEDTQNLPEGADLGLGCGNPTAIAGIAKGEIILDLGSGAGFDCFVAARQTGPTGKVIGVDMTPEMISKARQNAAASNIANVEFRLGEIERLPVADASVDLILSNCVINLSPDKASVFREAYRVLKEGGRLALSDIVATRPLPHELKDDFAAYTGCVAGAATVEEIERLLKEAGFIHVTVEQKSGSREFINQWLPGKNAGDYVVSAIISARK